MKPHPSDPTPVKVVRSEEILEGGKQVYIEHGESLYRLSVTKQGKLILNK